MIRVLEQVQHTICDLPGKIVRTYSKKKHQTRRKACGLPVHWAPCRFDPCGSRDVLPLDQRSVNQNSTSHGPWNEPGPEQLHEPGVAEAANKHSAEEAFEPIGSTNPGFRPLNQRMCSISSPLLVGCPSNAVACPNKAAHTPKPNFSPI